MQYKKDPERSFGGYLSPKGVTAHIIVLASAMRDHSKGDYDEAAAKYMTMAAYPVKFPYRSVAKFAKRRGMMLLNAAMAAEVKAAGILKPRGAEESTDEQEE